MIQFNYWTALQNRFEVLGKDSCSYKELVKSTLLMVETNNICQAWLRNHSITWNEDIIFFETEEDLLFFRLACGI